LRFCCWHQRQFRLDCVAAIRPFRQAAVSAPRIGAANCDCALEGARGLSAVECLYAFRRHRSRIRAMAARRFTALAAARGLGIFVGVGDLR
jgi:hypothetical protein